MSLHDAIRLAAPATLEDPGLVWALSAYAEFSKGGAHRLFLVGEHTLFDFAGTTHGALMSGRRAARRIINH